MLSNIRLLPVTIFAAVLMLTVKLGHFWEEASVVIGSATIAETAAKSAPEIAAQGQPVPAPKETPAAEAGSATPTSAPAEGAGEGAAAAETSPEESSQDMMLFSESELDLLQSLSERRSALDQREEQLGKRERLLEAAEKRIDSKITEMRTIKEEVESVRAEIDKLLHERDEQEEQKLRSLVKIYETMKPKDAARIFDQLEMDVLLGVVERMKETKTAPILASMNPEKAKELTFLLAQKKQLPEFVQSQ